MSEYSEVNIINAINAAKEAMIGRVDTVKAELYGAIEKRDDRCRTIHTELDREITAIKMCIKTQENEDNKLGKRLNGFEAESRATSKTVWGNNAIQGILKYIIMAVVVGVMMLVIKKIPI